jgi:hypothetical protein
MICFIIYPLSLCGPKQNMNTFGGWNYCYFGQPKFPVFDFIKFTFFKVVVFRYTSFVRQSAPAHKMWLISISIFRRCR